MNSTRGSLAVETMSLRIDSACWASFESKCIRSSLVTPLTMMATLETELALDIVDGHLGVFDGVVQQGGRERNLVKSELGDDLGDRERMVDVRLAARASLRSVSRRGDARRPARSAPSEPLAAGRGTARQNGGEFVAWGTVLPPPGQDPVDGGHRQPSAPRRRR